MFCRKCGKEIPADSAFCPKCGMEVVQDNNEKNSPIEFTDHNKVDKEKQDETPVPTIDEYYSDQARDERRRKAEETARESERKAKKIKKIISCSVVGICVVVPLILYFSLRQFGYTHKNDGWYISRYYGSDVKVTIPTSHLGGTVVGISQNAFEDCNLELVEFSSKSNNGKFIIEEQAFYNCQYLETVIFNPNINEADISANAFENCISLNTVSIGGRSFHSLNQMRESQKVKPKDIDYDSMSEEEAKETRAAETSRMFKALSLSKFKFNKSAFSGCSRFNDAE